MHNSGHVQIPSSGRKKVMVVYGTRPEAIKVAPVVNQLADHPALGATTVVTGQHRSMLDQVNEIFGIKPDYDLDLFSHGQSLNALTSRIFATLDPVLSTEQPDAVLVQGDTTSVMAAAIASFYRGIPVVHLEAGLRSHNLLSPFPEEANRKLVSQVSSLHLAPTETSKQNLQAEGIDSKDIVITGNTVIDALLHSVSGKPEFSDPNIAEAIASGKRILLVTTHRRENWGNAMEGVGRALNVLATQFPQDLIVLPAHRNPVVRDALLPSLQGLDNVITCEPLPYGEFTHLLNSSHIVLTDSGGVQEEAPSLGKPVLVMRENTERPEAVVAGTVRLIGTNEERIVAEVSQLKSSPATYESMACATNPYGDGEAASRTVAAIAELLGAGSRLPEFSYSD